MKNIINYAYTMISFLDKIEKVYHKIIEEICDNYFNEL